MAHIDSLAWFREDEINLSFAQVRKALTMRYKGRTTRAVEDDEEGNKVWVTRTEKPQEPIHFWSERDEMIGVPLEWAFANINNCANILEDRTVRGSKIKVKRLPDPFHAKSPVGQDIFFNEMNEAIRGNYACLAQAPTGNGKTVAVLNSIGHALRTALIIVPNTTLADQWKKEIEKHLGLDPKDIGQVGDSRDSWKGKSIVVATVHSVSLREKEEDFYNYFGFVAWDEAHRLGSREFSKSMMRFPSSFKIAVTATPKRKDGMDELFYYYFGNVAVRAKAKALPVTCWTIKYPIIGNVDWINRCRNDAKPMKWLSRLEMRNQMLARLIVDMYNRGKEIIVLSRFIDHLELLMRMCVSMGIPKGDLGQYTRTQGKKKTRVGQAYLDGIKNSSRVIFATYSMAKEGFDCPRLDVGIEAMPVADNIQGIGRVRRFQEGKARPVWFSILDLNVGLFERYSKSRLRGFADKNVTIKEMIAP